MTALTDTLSWGAVQGATGYIVGVRYTTAPASQAGTYFWFGSTASPQMLVSQLTRGAISMEPLPTGVLLAAAVQTKVTTFDPNGFITAQTVSDWSPEITFTMDAPAVPAQGASQAAGKTGGLGSINAAPPAPTLAAPSAFAVSSP